VNARLALGTFSLTELETEAPTIADALQTWLRSYGPTFSRPYAALAEINVRVHLSPAFGHLRVNQLTENHMLEFIRAKTEGCTRPLRAFTLQNILSILRRVLELAVEEGHSGPRGSAQLEIAPLGPGANAHTWTPSQNAR
jgi:hypothetical protein